MTNLCRNKISQQDRHYLSPGVVPITLSETAMVHDQTRFVEEAELRHGLRIASGLLPIAWLISEGFSEETMSG